MVRPSDRILGRFAGQERGPLLVITGAIHGNEPAGIHAIERFFSLLGGWSSELPDITWRGHILGLVGNMGALRQGVRYIDTDLNRNWPDRFSSHHRSDSPDNQCWEERERNELYTAILHELQATGAAQLIFLDLHTTSAGGGVFCIPGCDGEPLATAMDVPVVLGLLDDLSGTYLGFTQSGFQAVQTRSLAFEGGLHEDEESVSHCLYAILQLCYAANLCSHRLADRFSPPDQWIKMHPRQTRVVYRHYISNATEWQMILGFRQFSPVQKGQLLARYQGRPVFAPNSGYLLMPLYQKQGHDAFFIVEE